MHDVGRLLPVDGVPEGATLLCLGPPMTGKSDLVRELLAVDDGPGAGTVLVTTDRGGPETFAAYQAANPGVDAARVAVVDASGDADPDPDPDAERAYWLETVPSPADLQALGGALARAIQAVQGEPDVSRVRVAVDSLSTLVTYTSTERVVPFLHVLTRQVAEAGGLAYVVGHSDTLDTAQFEQFRSLVDGVVEVADPAAPDAAGLVIAESPPTGVASDAPAAVRVVGLTPDPTEWVAVDVAARRIATPGEPAGRADVEVPESLGAVLDRIETRRPTLTVCNFDGPDAVYDDIADHFGTLNVDVRSASLDAETPRNVALLHRGDELVAAEPVMSVHSAIEVADDADAFVGQRTGAAQDVFGALSRSTYGARGADKQFLVEVSHVVEMLAWRLGKGELHAGFQRLSNLWGDPRSRRIYERLAETGVTVHVYGLPDTDVPDGTDVIAHPVRTEEVLNSWFVAFDGAGFEEYKATLLVEEREPRRYYGFWTYSGSVTDEVVAYLQETYGKSRATA